MVTFKSLAGRVALFVGGHVVALGLVIVLSMSAGQATSEGPVAAGGPGLSQDVTER